VRILAGLHERRIAPFARLSCGETAGFDQLIC
jgi:hypothetical protein